MWAISDYLTRQQRAIDEKYDYRYSRLVFVFAILLRENWLEETDLQGLGEEKLQAIQYMVSR